MSMRLKRSCILIKNFFKLKSETKSYVTQIKKKKKKTTKKNL